MISLKNIIVTGSEGRQMGVDVFCAVQPSCPVVVYMHGFNGFKDWGQFDLIAQQFAGAGFCFVKFNASHNGTTPEQPEDFTDLEAFGHNNYSKELFDLQAVIDFALQPGQPFSKYIDAQKLYLVGHSRGGGIVLLHAATDKRIKAVVTWASVAECKTPWGNWPQNRIDRWKETGVDYYANSRTGQNMPLYYQLYKDYEQNKERLDVGKAAAGLQVPVLICHGTNDEAVPFTAALALHRAVLNASLFLLPSDHVFGRRHPWPVAALPGAMQQVVDVTISFLAQQ